MKKPLPPPSEAELSVLEALWEDAPQTIRTLVERLYPGGGTAQYATVQKLLERLEAKGHVRRLRSSVPHRFKPKTQRESLIGHRLREVADSLCGGSMAPLLTQLIEQGSYAPEDVDELRSLLQRLEEEGA